ncbi:RNA polymerase sigma-70 factor (ECF subfamily) [Breznakibacter xylanolyticus]|uniref:RNA polymerase sigma-70 factor (ECF subfamily) n=1 Tax=Breznakibacter xylanolyticus TaxID=990 RepID=A0A2W7NBA9_9BACT|nr:sigma-70 family RNA polymerase sigma factor [Breznakibacter xylanolyticus]PZX10296.1 RNA polymerase sigma-70 factor (ECF subfamily) [Breznakibacter xylanolyticus]
MPRLHLEPSVTDESLAESFAQTGNVELAGDLFERYMQPVYGVCLKYLRERDAAKEMVMRVFEKMVAELPHVTVNAFKPWLYVVTKNLCLMELRSRKSARIREQRWGDRMHADVENDVSRHLYQQHDAHVLSEALRDCMTRLNDHQRECIELFYFEELSYQQIADSTTLETGKVKSYIQNGKRNLKICMEKKAL